MPYSYGFFKNEIIDYMYQYIQNNNITKILDVGPGCGTYGNLFKDKNILLDAVEIFEPNINKFNLKNIYKNVYLSDIRIFDISNYEFIIIGDVLEHLSIEDAQKILNNINNLNIKCMIAVPYKAPQGAFEGNDAEIHLQDDLTKEIMNERYPSLNLVYGNNYYGYYVNFDYKDYKMGEICIVNDKKIQFITCVTDENVYYIHKLLLKNLILPEGYSVEFTNINNAVNIASAYNLAISASDAKYRVYLNENVFIINNNFINNLIDMFINNPNIGMIGSIGCKTLPKNGIWQDSNDKYGKIYKNKKEIIMEYNDIKNDYEQVNAIDGNILITQYDIPWRDDIFDSLYFYDISQCLEFQKFGYLTVLSKELPSWYIYNENKKINMNDYEKYRLKFMNEYLNNKNFKGE